LTWKWLGRSLTTITIHEASWEQWGREETKKRDGNSRDEEIGNESEDELEGDGRS
jgi:hypothetical protein